MRTVLSDLVLEVAIDDDFVEHSFDHRIMPCVGLVGAYLLSNVLVGTFCLFSPSFYSIST